MDLEDGAELQEPLLDPVAGADGERRSSLGPGQAAGSSKEDVADSRADRDVPRLTRGFQFGEEARHILTGPWWANQSEYASEPFHGG